MARKASSGRVPWWLTDLGVILISWVAVSVGAILLLQHPGSRAFVSASSSAALLRAHGQPQPGSEAEHEALEREDWLVSQDLLNSAVFADWEAAHGPTRRILEFLQGIRADLADCSRAGPRPVAW